MQASERETSVAYTAEDDTVYIYSCIRPDITAMKKKDQFRLLEEGEYADGTLWANFSIPAERFDIARAAKGTRSNSPEARARMAENLRKAREAKA